MIKLIVAIRRNPAMTPAEFHRYWRTEHARKVRAIPACDRYIRRYVQAHTADEAYESGEPAFDGTAELWFDSLADMNAFYSDPEYLATVQPDEKVFADMSATLFFVTREETVVG
ncbi:MAG: EthD domain-containing protein [Gemmatimonadota bacterium]|nr:EthD domain-containing protein [Gemmatimonadota bacterium]